VDRFLSNGINRIDSKGRVSVPAHFRSVLAQRGLSDLYAMQAIGSAAVNAGGMDLLEQLEVQIGEKDPFGAEAEDLSFFIHGDGAFLKLDTAGRITVTDFIRDHTGITDQVTFVGRGHFFQMWEPTRFAQYRETVRARLARRREAPVT